MQRFIISAALLAALASGATGARDGDLDTSFGSGGKVTAAIDLPGGLPGANLTDLGIGTITQADGKLLIIGRVYPDSPEGAQIACVRLNADQSRDTTYGPLGVRKLATQFNSGIAGLVSATQSSFVLYGTRAFPLAIAGTTPSDTANGTKGNTANADFWLHGVGNDCTTNASFGDGGTKRIGFDLGGGNADFATAAFIGDVPVRLFITGSVEAGGNPDRDFGIAVLDINGNLQTSFDTDGKARVFFDIGGVPNDDYPTSIIGRSGKVMVAGYARQPDTNPDLAFARLITATGAADPTFCPTATPCANSLVATPGKRTVDSAVSNPTNEFNAQVTVGFDGAIYAAATTRLATNEENLLLVKMMDNGTLDPAWGGGTGQKTGPLLAHTRPAYISLLGTGLIVAGTTAVDEFAAIDPQSRFFTARFEPSSGNGDLDYAAPGSCVASFCATYTFAPTAGQPQINDLVHVNLLQNSRLLLTGSRLFSRAGGVNDFDFALARTQGGIVFSNGFE